MEIKAARLSQHGFGLSFHLAMQLDTANTFPFPLTSTYTLRISTARRERLCPHPQVPTASLQSSGLKDELQASLQGLSEMGIFGSNQIWSIHRNETDGRCQIGPSALGLEAAGICQTNTGKESLFFFFFLSAPGVKGGPRCPAFIPFPLDLHYTCLWPLDTDFFRVRFLICSLEPRSLGSHTVTAQCTPTRSFTTKPDHKAAGPLEIVGCSDFPFYGRELQRFAALPHHCSWQEESGWWGESDILRY